MKVNIIYPTTKPSKPALSRYASFNLLALLLILFLVACSPATRIEDRIPTSLVSRPTPEGKIHASELAGSWYPEDKGELANMVAGLLDEVTPIDGQPVALIVPHAGYVYSGPVAAYGFKQLAGYDYQTAVIIASDHQSPLSNPISVWSEGGFETPLGVVPVDVELAQAIVDSHPAITSDQAPYAGEHPIEIELPFLQLVCPSCAILPILMGDASEESVQVLSEALAANLEGRKAVVIASSDLSHYPKYEHAQIVDSATLSAIESGDPALLQETISESMLSGFPNLVTCACGEGPILVAMRVAQALGADTVSVLRYANSGDSSYGGRGQVVGYGAVMFWQYEPPDLSERQKEGLLSLARDTIAQFLVSGEMMAFETSDEDLARRSAVFVTLMQAGELRGCIGVTRATLPLYQAVQQAAISAATEDPRFPPLKKEELSEVTIEISVLSPFRRITDLNLIQVGRHGLKIYKNGQAGLLLPQVPTEQGWDRDQFLENLCRKAGLPADCWIEEAALYTFEAVVFNEQE